MTLIVGIHGIAQQVRGPEVLRQAWAPALRDGVVLSGAEPPDGADLEIAFYGDLFRAQGGKAVGGPRYVASDVEEGFERELLEAWWAETAAGEEGVPDADAKTKLRTPKTVQRALNALSQSRFFAGLTERLIIGFIKQVHAYLETTTTTACGPKYRRGWIAWSAPEPLCWLAIRWVRLSPTKRPARIRAGIWPWSRWAARLASAILSSSASGRCRTDGRGQFPAGAATWTNIADTGDVVALVKRLAPLFGDRVQDLLVNNGSNAHDVSPYLTAVQTGHAIAEGLARRAR